MSRDLDLDALVLHAGIHQAGSRMCIMEAAAYVAGEPWSDRPQCVSPFIGTFLRSWNDALDDETRNRLLKPYILKVVGTRTTNADEATRAWLATDWLVRVHTPAWLELAGLPAAAEQLRGLTPLTSNETALAAQETLDTVRRHSEERMDAESDAAMDEAWFAAMLAPRFAARTAAWFAARAAVLAWDAARTAVVNAAWFAEWSAAEDAALSWAALWDAAWVVARSASRTASSAALVPTVEKLQKSALELLDRMIDAGRGTPK